MFARTSASTAPVAAGAVGPGVGAGAGGGAERSHASVDAIAIAIAAHAARNGGTHRFLFLAGRRGVVRSVRGTVPMR
jgi:hypothetical protein